MAAHRGSIVDKGITAQVEETLGRGAITEAKSATQAEHELTLWQAIRTHKKAVFWSAVISMSIVMEGYA
jgi:SP family general alpha glucoside:H+ symporter-like MFS transporter